MVEHYFDSSDSSQAKSSENSLEELKTEEVERSHEVIDVDASYEFLILTHWRETELKNLTENCLYKHSISSRTRASMIDWMLEVTVHY